MICLQLVFQIDILASLTHLNRNFRLSFFVAIEHSNTQFCEPRMM